MLGVSLSAQREARAQAPSEGWSARADDPVVRGAPKETPSAGRRAAAISAALLPGLFWHGLGHLTLGEVETAHRLAWLESAGLLVAGMSAGALVTTGASPRAMPWSIWGAIGGGGVFFLSWMADIYGVAAAGEGALAPRASAPWTGRAGYLYAYDPQFAGRHAALVDVTGWWHTVWARPALMWGPGIDNPRGRLDLGWRLWGPRPGQYGEQSWLEARAGSAYQWYGEEQFTSWTTELTLAGRLDLMRIGPTMRGAYAQGSLGLGWDEVDYRLPGVSNELQGLLLGGFGFGVYLPGEDPRGGGEVELYYDHRRDDLVSGLGTTGLGGGFLGYFGLRASAWVGGWWGVEADLRAGSAYVAGLNLIWRAGGDDATR